jgi:hypothetical protein
LHRLAWLLHYKQWPEGVIDHINGDKVDNRISNLRDVTQKDNLRGHMTKRKGATSVFRGVHLNTASGKWVVKIRIGGKMTHIGVFEDERDAALAWDLAAEMEGYSTNTFNQIKYQDLF